MEFCESLRELDRTLQLAPLDRRMVEKVRPSTVERRPSMTSAAELRDQMLNRRTSSATEAQAMRERNVDADMLNRQEMRGRTR